MSWKPKSRKCLVQGQAGLKGEGAAVEGAGNAGWKGEVNICLPVPLLHLHPNALSVQIRKAQV